MKDYDIATVMTIPDTLPEEQYIIYDLARYSTDYWVRGVMFHTYEAEMTSGTIEFFVDGEPCPDTGGVGVNAIGGVFNCGLYGRHFEVRCTDVCSPNFAVSELKVFIYDALTVDGTSYIWDDSTIAWPPTDIDKVF